MVFNFFLSLFAAIGFVCTLYSLYDILFSGFPAAKTCAELYLCFDSQKPGAEQLLRAASRARRVFLPGLPVTFIDTGDGCEPLQRLAEKLDIDYFKM